ncbi:MAG: DNA polymerase III subunit [Pedosphaera sp.]|nr:DNA polymerase III subunit [Pedosphaera sp.]
MAFKDFPEQEQGVALLQRSLERGRLGHAYLFTGQQLDELEALARTLAKTLNCAQPVKAGGVAVDGCDTCANCRKTDAQTHPDVHWVRPESKSRVILIEQLRELMQAVNLKPAEGGYKVAIIVAADRLNASAANAFLKTLEEPPSRSVLILLSIEPQRLLETILSRCLRLNFTGEGRARFDATQMEWLGKFSAMAAGEQKSLLGRYRLMDVLLQKLTELKERVEESLTARSPLEQYPDAEKDLREKWEEELKASVEAEYRRQRGEMLLLVQWWLRDVWLLSLAAGAGLLNFPNVSETRTVAARLSPERARENLRVLEQTQRLLHTNVQEALALEVGLLKLQF